MKKADTFCNKCGAEISNPNRGYSPNYALYRIQQRFISGEWEKKGDTSHREWIYVRNVARNLSVGLKVRYAMMKKHIEVIERMMFALANFTVDGKRIHPTLLIAKDALEKRLPRAKFYSYEQNVKDTQRVTICPICKLATFTAKNEKPGFCCWCGQALDWSEISEA